MATGMTEEIGVGQLTITFRLDGERSGGSIAAFEFTVPAGAGVPGAHSHDGYEETIYGLAGTLHWTVAGQETDVGPGDILCIPRGVAHHFENIGSADARMLAILTPGILGPAYFRELAAVVSAASGPPDPGAVADVMRRHGLTPTP